MWCRLIISAFLLVLSTTSVMAGQGSATLEQVRLRGVLNCGVIPGNPAFSQQGTDGQWHGFFADWCRALSAAVIGDGRAVHFIEVTPATRFEALARKKVDVVMSNTTWTHSREYAHKVRFPAVYLYDGQAVATRKNTGWRQLAQANQATVCVEPSSTSHANLQDYAQRHGLSFTYLPLKQQGIINAFLENRCDLITDDRIALTANIKDASSHPEDYILFPQTLSREPLAPMVRADDENWIRVVRMVVHALMVADEKGISTAKLTSDDTRLNDPEVQRLLGSEEDPGQFVGLSRGWARRAITTVGHYGELFARHLGTRSDMKMPRLLNRPWSRGGLFYAPPFR
ncbi:amino acid ABC transporter substrate-binding protein [Magnetococcus sp. PR-3]|uniref:amino acid ABC transporter substrate-binding protein n=1 Tax=Magnetococcus sp. PR-3 TaxID=3120355 RepID=UPI002FCE42D9